MYIFHILLENQRDWNVIYIYFVFGNQREEKIKRSLENLKLKAEGVIIVLSHITLSIKKGILLLYDFTIKYAVIYFNHSRLLKENLKGEKSHDTVYPTENKIDAGGYDVCKCSEI